MLELAQLEVVVPGSPRWRVGPVALAVAPGERLVLMGPSGAGKTSLLRAIVGLDRVAAGAVRVAGADVTRRPPWARGIGLAGQDAPHHPQCTVRRNLELALRSCGLDRAAIADRVAEVADALELDGLLERSAAVLSGGELRRLAIARALAPRPAVLLLDEPFAHLDRPLRGRVAELVAEATRGEVAVVLVAHEPEPALALATRVAFLERTPGGDARIVQVGTAAELAAAPATATVAAFLAGAGGNAGPPTAAS